MTIEAVPAGTFEQTLSLSPGGKVRVLQARGRLSISGWDRPMVHLVVRGAPGRDVGHYMHIHSRSEECHIEVRESGGWLGGLLSPALDLELQVPALATLALDVGATDVDVTGVCGPAEIDAGSGKICCRDMGSLAVDCGSGGTEIRGARGRVAIDSGSGGVWVSDVQGDVQIDAGSGDLILERVEGSVQAETGSGCLELQGVTGGSARLETGSGSVRVGSLRVRTLALETGSGSAAVELAAVDPQGSYGIETGSGAVDVRLPADARLTVRIEASPRQIENALPLTDVSMGDDELRGLLGGGGAVLHIEAGGRVRLSSNDAVAIAAEVPKTSPASPVLAPPPLAPLVPPPSAAQPHDLEDEYHRVLRMVEEGRLQPEEAEAILRALEEGTGEEQP